MREFLGQFHKRMELVAVVDSIVNRRNTSEEMEQNFQREEMDNILLSILVFIMEMTLTEDSDCTMSSIEDFLREILPAYQKVLPRPDVEALARYLVKDILQNKGTRRDYRVMDYEQGPRQITVRLITDRINDRNEVVYSLTQQGYNFLFRTKEVDEELGFQLEEMRLKMLIHKKNYKRALEQSRELLRMLNEKRSEMQQFELQLRSNLSELSGADYEELVLSVDHMLDDEYRVMQDINDMVELATAHLVEQARIGDDTDERSQQAKREIDAIEENVGRALTLQRTLLTRCEGLRTLYLGLLEDAFQYQQSQTYDIEQVLLKPMEALERLSWKRLEKIRNGLLTPLFLPQMPHTLNLKLAYLPQGTLSDTDDSEVAFDEETVGDEERLDRERRRSGCHVALIRLLFQYAAGHTPGFSLQDFSAHLEKSGQALPLLRERLLFLDMLKLYELGEIDLVLWRREGMEVDDAGGEFDLAYCLTQIGREQPGFWSVSFLHIESGPLFQFRWQEQYGGVCFEEIATVNNLYFEVRLDEASAEGFS